MDHFPDENAPPDRARNKTGLMAPGVDENYMLLELTLLLLNVRVCRGTDPTRGNTIALLTQAEK